MHRSEDRPDVPEDATTEFPRLAGGHREAPADDPWITDKETQPKAPANEFGPGGTPPPGELSDVTFPSAWRGYEPTAVDAYVRQVARTIADLQSSSSPADAVTRALDRVGEETSSILREAEHTAERMTAKSRSEADERVQRAEREADAITLAARTRLRQLDGDVDRIWLERQRLIDDTRTLADRLLLIADQAEERFPAEEDVSDDTTVSDTGRPLGRGRPPEASELSFGEGVSGAATSAWPRPAPLESAGEGTATPGPDLPVELQPASGESANARDEPGPEGEAGGEGDRAEHHQGGEASPEPSPVSRAEGEPPPPWRMAD